jgi:hypothetical protein
MGGVAIVRKNMDAVLEYFAFLVHIALFIVSALAVLGLLNLVAVVYYVATGYWAALASLPAIYAFLWPICSLYYLAIESMPTGRRFTFPFGAIAVPVWSLARKHRPPIPTPPSRRQIISFVRTAIIVGCGILLVQISTKGWHFGHLTVQQNRHLHNILVWVAWSIILASMAILPTVDRFNDWRWLRKWRRSDLHGNAEDVFAWLSSLRTSWGAKELITVMTKREPARDAIRVLTSVSELAGVLEWVKDLGPPKGTSPMREEVLRTMPSYFRPDVSQWVRAYDRRHPGRLYSIAVGQRATIKDYVVAVNHFAAMSGSVQVDGDR